MVEKIGNKILSKPLPEILNELEDLIAESKAATTEARKAAGEAHQAGLKAAGEAARVATEKIAAAESRLQDRLAALDARIGQVFEFAQKINIAQVSALNAAVEAYNEKIG
jgi:hypothetical protein